jgi:GTP-binding protein YchF
VDLGLVGRTNAGKTALFNLITGSSAEVAPYPFTTREALRGVAEVPDARIDAIADAQDIPRRVRAQVQVVDIPGLAAGAGQGEGLGGKALGELRQTDALIHVIRGFANREVPHPEDAIDPVPDAEAIDLELMLADREQVERRLEKVRKGAKSGDAAARTELGLLAQLAAALDAGTPLRMAADQDARVLAADMGLLTAKPVLYVLNTDDPGDPPADLATYAAARGSQAVALAVGTELELAQLGDEEAAELAVEMELGEVRGADAMVRAAYELLDLVTFFTGSGPPEARAWPIRRGLTADRAAGKIHSDMERGFIRAEVVPWEDLVRAGSFAKAREAAQVRMEGKDYIVQEGDVMQIRFAV